jgi:ABC-type Zn uptake system ZnuABC Zn-binding protein ZnuA
MKAVLLFVALSSAASFLLAGCGHQSDSEVTHPGPVSASKPALAEEHRKPRILVTSWPLLEMTSFIAEDILSVSLAVPDGRVSRTWRPATDDILKMQSAGLLLLNGAGYEPWKTRVSLPNSRVVEISNPFEDRLIAIPDAVWHRHGPEGGHSHPGTVWATWLDPEIALRQSAGITAACSKLSPASAARFAARAALLDARLEEADLMLRKLAESEPTGSDTVAGDGPYYQYLLRRLGWKLSYLHWPEPGQDLTTKDLDQLGPLAGKSGARLFLMISSRDELAAAAAENAGLRVVRIDLCERMSETGISFADRLKQNVENLAAVMKSL